MSKRKSRMIEFLHMLKPTYARVIIDRSIHRELDYSVPETLAGESTLARACVFRSAKNRRWPRSFPCWNKATLQGIRPIEAVLGDKPVLSKPFSSWRAG